MADEEAEPDHSPADGMTETMGELKLRLERVREVAAGGRADSPAQSSAEYCQEFCGTLLEFAGRWKIEEDPLPLLRVYMVALQSYAEASPLLSLDCENVPLVVERLSLSFLELLLSLKDIPDELWTEVKSCVQFAHDKLQENGISQLLLLSAVGQYDGVWSHSVLQCLLSGQEVPKDQVEQFLAQEGSVLLQMRVKQLMKEKETVRAAARLAKACCESSAFSGKGLFKQMFLVCLCNTSEQSQLMEELSNEDCNDALEMICNLESEGDNRAAFSLCSAFLTRQLLQGDTYCAWELTLFWSKLLKRLEPADKDFLDRCRQMSLLSKTAYHILFLIKVIQSEIDSSGLSVSVELCIRALRLELKDGKSKATVCKTISCLLGYDLEVKRACQLTEFLLEPTVDAYYAVETLYNEPDQKLEEESMPIPNSLRCELLLVLKTQWPFDPEFWDWKTLKRHCLAMMGEEASIVSSIDSLNDPEEEEGEEELMSLMDNIPDHLFGGMSDLEDAEERKQKNREMKELREKGFVSARFRNWQVYMQYCVLCDKEFLGHRIVRHAQIHVVDGKYSCPICTETFASKDTLIPHVTTHVKQSCKERLTAMKSSKNLANAKAASPVIPALKAKAQNELHKNGGKNVFAQNIRNSVAQFNADSYDGNVCPVEDCRRSFKFYKNLIAHVKGHGDIEEAKIFLELRSKKVVCQYCRRHFISINHLNDHLQVHCGVKPYICIQLNCRASFLSNMELLTHKKTHTSFKAKCMFPNCGKIFNAAFELYDHEAQHYQTFTCKLQQCGKVFHSQQQLDLHMEKHRAQEEESRRAEETLKNLKAEPPVAEGKPRNVSADPVEDVEKSLDTQTANSFNQTTPTMSMEFPQKPVEPEKPSAGLEKPFGELEKPFGETEKPFAELQRPFDEPERTFTEPIRPFAEPERTFTEPIRPFAEPERTFTEPIRPFAEPEKPFAELERPCNTEVLPPPVHSIQQCDLKHSVIHSVHPQPTEPNRQAKDFAPYSPVGFLPPPNYPQAPPINTVVKPCQKPLLPKTPGTGAHGYPSMLPIPPQKKSVPVRNLLAMSLSQVTPVPAMSQPLPPSANLQQPAGNMTERLPAPAVSSSAALSGFKERFHCAFGTCTRDYSSYRSVTKHMKAVHPEFYEQWKVHKTNIRVTYVPASPMPSPRLLNPVGSLQNPQASSVATQGPQRENVIQSPPYGSGNRTSTPPFMSLLASLSQNHSSSTLMENVLSPIVMSQLTNNRNPAAASSQGSVGQNWLGPVSGEQVCNPPQPLPPGVQDMPQPDPTRVAPPQSAASCPLMGQLINNPQSIIPPHINHVRGTTQQTNIPPACEAQAPNEMGPSATSSDQVMTGEGHNHFNISLFNERANPIQNCQPHSSHFTSEIGVEDLKSQRKHPRVKWPAIVRNGKFMCRLCFREFDSPKSLGGHLSKRTTCKPFMEANAELPQSFLGLLNSDKPIDAEHSDLSYGCTITTTTATYEKPLEALPCGSDAAKDYSFQNNIPTCENTSTHDMLKEIMTESNLSDLFISAPAQPLIQNSCAPFGPGDRLHSGSVIQHTENVQFKPEVDPHSKVAYPQTVAAPPAGKSPNSHLAHVAPQNPQAAPSSGAHTNNTTSAEGHTTSYHSGMSSQIAKPHLNSVIHAPAPDTRAPQVMTPSQTKKQKIMADNLIKKKLREQILAGEFQRRNSMPLTGNVEAKPQTFNPSSNFVFHRTSFDINKEPSSRAPLLKDGFKILTGSPSEIEKLLSKHSFKLYRDRVPSEGEPPVPADVPERDMDTDPAVLTFEQQDCFNEIQLELERLDLLRERAEATPVQMSPDTSSQASPPNAQTESTISLPYVKPFVCEIESCRFSSVSSDVLWRHLSKTHNFSSDMINVVKKKYGKYAPFKCQQCVKAFTRNSNLRAHYLSFHKLSVDEITELDEKRRVARAAQLAVYQKANKTRSPENNHIRQLPTPNAAKSEAPVSSLPNHAPINGITTIAHAEPAAPMHCQAPTPMKLPQSPERFFASGQQPMSQFQSSLLRVLNQPTHTEQEKEPFRSMMPTVHSSLTSQTVKQERKSESFNKPVRLTPDKPKKSQSKTPKHNLPSYRPYSCVHQGCTAAFSVQHNLILHYRAVHQSALSALEVNNDSDGVEDAEEDGEEAPAEPGEEEDEAQGEAEIPEVSEFRCQVRDCCFVFQEFTSLFQHYLKLHKYGMDRIFGLLSSIRIGKFPCGHQDCAEFFTSVQKYIAHVRQFHKDVRIRRSEQLSFKCVFEGCDRSYATKSNMLRHAMRKHGDQPPQRPKKERVRGDQIKPSPKTLLFQVSKTSNGKENIESNKKDPLRPRDVKRATNSKTSHWINYGKPSLKSKVEACAMCTKKFPLQYPCMIKGCDYVTKAERSIMKHYVVHGLSEKYLELHRSHFIFCKKFPKLKNRFIRSDDSRSDRNSDLSDNDASAESMMEEGQQDESKPILRRRAPSGLPGALFDNKLSANKRSSLLIKRKRGRPRKFMDKTVKRRKITRAPKVVYNREHEAVSNPPAGQPKSEPNVPLASFQPMGFEMSFLKFLEQSNKPGQASGGPGKSAGRPRDISVRFNNPQKLKSLCRVQISLDGAFSRVCDSMLKQLQSMLPAVVLEKHQ